MSGEFGQQPSLQDRLAAVPSGVLTGERGRRGVRTHQGGDPVG